MSRRRRKAQSQPTVQVDGIGTSAQRCSRQRELARSSSHVCVCSARQLRCRQATPGHAAVFWNEPENAPTLHACARQGDDVRPASLPCNQTASHRQRRLRHRRLRPNTSRPARLRIQLRNRIAHVTRQPHAPHTKNTNSRLALPSRSAVGMHSGMRRPSAVSTLAGAWNRQAHLTT